MAGTLTVAEKEMKDQFGSKRFLILFGFMILLSGLAAYQGVDFIKNNTEATFVYIFSGTQMTFSFIQIMVMFGPILGMAMGFDAINKERTTGTLSIPASIEALYLLSPAIISNLLSSFRTTIGLMIPFSLIESANSFNSFSSNFLRGWFLFLTINC